MILEIDDEQLVSPLRPWLKVIFPQELATESPVGPGPLVIGRSHHRANLVLDDDLISRRHCRLYWENGEIRIEDLGSTNGTFIDGIKVENAPLPTSSKLQVGRVILKLEMRRSSAMNTAELPISPSPLATEELRNEAEEYLAQCKKRKVALGALLIDLSIDSSPSAELLEFVMSEVGEVLRRELLSDDLLGELSPQSHLLLTSDISAEQLLTFEKTLCGWIDRQRFIFEGEKIELHPKIRSIHLDRAPSHLEELLSNFQ